MIPNFATLVLARLSLVVSVLFMLSAWKVYSLDPKAKANRIAFIFNVVFALWAFGSSFWYTEPSQDGALKLYKAFSWTWCVFPPLILHFSLRVVGSRILDSKRRELFFAALYLPSLFLSLTIPNGLLSDPVFRGGYWMLAVRTNALYYFFVLHYFILVLVSVIVMFSASSRAGTKRSRRRLRLLGWSYLIAGVLGFITDTVFLILGIDFPNMAIHWIMLLSLGMLVSMERFGFLSILPAKEALRVLESMAGFVIYLDDADSVIWANPSALEAMGVPTLSEARRLSLSDFIGAESLERVRATMSDDTEARGQRLSFGPKAIPVSLRAHGLGGSTEGTVITAVDLRAEHARARTERRLADAGLLLDEFLARSLDGIVLTDTQGHIMRWNEPLAQITGISAREALGAYYWDIRSSVEPPESRKAQRIQEAVQSVLRGERAGWTRRIIETEIERRDGARRIIQSDSFPIPLAEGTILATIARDISDEKRKAAENIERIRSLDHAQKLEAIGTLSGGIAHDFNNTLAGIVGALSLIRQEIESGSCTDPRELTHELDIIERAAQRATSSVKRLLTLTRKRSPESIPFSLDEALKRMIDFAKSSLDQSVDIRQAGELPKAVVKGDQGQVEQLILNLMINAEHAMTSMRPRGQARGGELRLSLSGFLPDRSFLASYPGSLDRPYWRLTVGDQGVGIARQAMSRIFDPFYTTKPGESSSGLGLAMVQAIIRQHDGFIEVRSELGKGTEFSLYFPAYMGEAEHQQISALSGARRGLVLLADDDAIARETAVALLEALGYEVVSALSGAEALRIFNARPDDWHAAVLDMRMGELGGDEAGMHMRAVRPDLPLVLASGFHDEDTPRHFDPSAAQALIDKPFTMTELAKAMDAATGRMRGSAKAEPSASPSVKPEAAAPEPPSAGHA
jgi:PAS domain S-box-containing protein